VLATMTAQTAGKVQGDLQGYWQLEPAEET
jgi:hypothetical protein